MSFVDLFLMLVLQTLNTVQAVAIALGYLLELDGKTLMQKTPHSRFTSHEKNQVSNDRKCPPAG